MTKITRQDQAPIGAPISYQAAGMPEPLHGYVTGHPGLSWGLFVDFPSDPGRSGFQDMTWLKLGHLPAWYKQNANGKWMTEESNDG